VEGHPKRLRVLILEPSRADAQLMVEGLRRAGFEVAPEFVASEAEFERGLGGHPDLILADSGTDGFGALAALDRWRELGSAAPVIVVSGTPGEELAAQTIKAGATDYLLKGRLTRLGAAAGSALREAAVLRANAAIEAERAERAARISGIVQNLVDAVLTLNPQGVVETANPAALRLFGPGAALVGLRVTVLLTRPGGRPPAEAQPGSSDSPRWLQGRGVRLDGSTFAAEWYTSSIGPGQTMVLVRDITSQRALLNFLAHRASHDSLTRLPNRYIFMDRLEQAVEESKRYGTKRALMEIDLDHFKSINDAYGHAVGDQALRILGLRLRNALRAADTPARIGGDEFAVLLAGRTGRASAVAVAQKLCEALRQPMVIEHHKITCSASIGVAFFPGEGTDVETLMTRADAAMYWAKRHGLGVATQTGEPVSPSAVASDEGATGLGLGGDPEPGVRPVELESSRETDDVGPRAGRP